MSGENNHFFGKAHSAENLAKMSAAKKGENNPMFGKTFTHSAETRALIAAKIYKKVYVYSIDSISNERILYKSFDSCIDAAKYFDCTKRTTPEYSGRNKLYKKQWILSSS